MHPLQAAIQALEAQRAALGDAVVDAALAPLRAQWLAERAGSPAAEPHAGAAAAAQALRQLTILFLDVVGSTALSGRLDPEEVHAVVDGLLKRGTAIVRAHGGKVLQYAGDSLLAVFGAEHSEEDDAERAVLCGLALLAEGRAAAAEVLTAHDHAGFDVRVGLHTGPVLLGGGVDGEGAVRGLAVNVAARMEQTAPPGTLRISQDTYRQVQGAFDVLAQDPIAVKGVDEPMVTWLVLRARPRAQRAGARGIEGLRTALVGRSAEWLALQDAWARLHAGRRQELVLLVAEAGLGKSRLLAEFDRWMAARPEPWQAIRGRADPQTERQPYGLLRDMLAAWLHIDDGDSQATARRKIEQGIVPLLDGEDGPDLAQAHAHLLGHLIGIDFGDSPHLRGILDDPGQLRTRAFHALALVLRRLGAPGRPPIVLMLDDLHWADDGSLDLLDALRGANADVPMLVLGLTRPTLFERRPAWREPRTARRIELAALDAPASARLAAELLQRLPSVPSELTELLTARAGGNPFYMEELVKMLIDQGAVRAGAEGWTLHRGRLRLDAVPPTLAGVLQARMDRLPVAERFALQQASVIGAVFWAPALAALDRAAPAQLPALVQRRLVLPRADSSLQDADEYAFGHHLLREVAYDSVLKRTRRELHGRVGAWLAAQTGLRAEGLTGLAAEHFEKAGDAPRACEFYARAAAAARQRYAHDAVLAAVGRALPLVAACDAAQQPELRWRLLDARERTLDLLGRRAEQREDLRLLQDLAEAAGDDRRRSDLLSRRCLLAMRTGELAGAPAFAREAMALATRAGDAKLRLNAHRLLADSLARQGDVASALRWAESGLAEARAAGLRGLESRFLNALTVIHAQQNDLGALLHACREATRLRQELGDRRNEAIGLATLGGVWMALGQFDEAARALHEALRLHRAVGNRAQEPIALANLSQLALWRGQADAAREHAQAALALASEVRAGDLETFALWCLGNAELARSAPDLARAAFQRALAVAEAGGSAYALDARSGLARVALAEDDAAGALREVDPVLAHRAAGGTLQGTLAPRLVDLSCWQALDRAGDRRAPEWLRAAEQALRADAAGLNDPALRQGFLEAVPEHRALVEAAARSRAAAGPVSGG